MTKEFSFNIAFEKFNDEKRIDLNFGLNVFYGESGSGKSLTARALMGLLPAPHAVSYTHLTLPTKRIV